MYFSKFTKFVFLSTALALQACAAAPFPQVTAGDFELIHATTAVPNRLLASEDTPTIGPFVPSAANLIVNATVPQGVPADLGWIFASVGNNSDTAAFDGFAKNITILYTPPGGVEHLAFGPGIGNADGFCGIFPGFWLKGALDSSVLGTYTGRWLVEFGESTQPDAPVNPNSGCGPEPFNSTTVEFVRTWEVVAA
ncbi:hypothetical protein B0H12DRAFT_1238355 [Mycena haematopus]|nr:hypothetical protein B0H12DRAFT_1238355 [Mycena haematopus]